MNACLFRRPRLGFLGLGHMGHQRLEALCIAGGGEIVGLADTDPASCHRARRLVPAAAVCPSFDELLTHELDGIVIATPTGQHAEQARRALARGVAVFCQQPFTRTADETRRVLDAGSTANCLIGVDLPYRHARAFTAIETLVREGRIGTMSSAHLTFHLDSTPARSWATDRGQAGGGCAIELGTHAIDLALRLMGSSVRSVSSRLFAGGARLTSTSLVAEDLARIHIEFTNGSLATIHCSWNLPPGADAVIDCRWYGTTGDVRLANVRGSLTEFVGEHIEGIETRVIAAPPDQWAGRAICEWARELGSGVGYRERPDLLAVADVIDRAYDGLASTEPRGAAAADAPSMSLAAAPQRGA